jgi:hypothetical protein
MFLFLVYHFLINLIVLFYIVKKSDIVYNKKNYYYVIVLHSFSFFYNTLAKNLIQYSSIIIDSEQQAYLGHSCVIGLHNCIVRKAKITPKKTGQFVTLWKRNNIDKKIEPYHQNDTIDFFIIFCDTLDDHRGLFVFPKSILLDNKIIQSDSQEGKLAMRVYPPWATNLNKTAAKAFFWQLPFFISTHEASFNNKITAMFL